MKYYSKQIIWMRRLQLKKVSGSGINRMKLFIVAAIDPFDLKPGGTETYVMNLINSVANCNTEITLVGISQNGNQTQHNFNFVPIIKNIQISNYKFLSTLLLKVPFLRIPKSAVIHVQRPDMMLPFIVYNKNNTKICTLHGLPAKGIFLKRGVFVGKIYLLMEKYCLKHTDVLIAVSEATKSTYLIEYPWLEGKIHFIPVGFDSTKFNLMDKNRMRDKYNFNMNDKIILSAGRFEKEKNLDLLLQSFKLISNEIPDSKLILVGEGREKQNLQLLSRELNIDVTFMDAVNPGSLAEILNCADVFSLTSLYESGPLTVLESLACGIPVVTTDVGRVREFITTRICGTIVKRDEREFANAIIYYLNYENKHNKALCRQSVINFSFDTTGKKTIDLYQQIKSA
jgi:L-malate glycosyltransferase